jgi:hypothetical protein
MLSSLPSSQVGDFLKLHNREMLPADVVLIAAYEPDPTNPTGQCHVETKSLDVRHSRTPMQLMQILARP